MIQLQPYQIVFVNAVRSHWIVGDNIVHPILLANGLAALAHFRNQRRFQPLHIRLNLLAARFREFLLLLKLEIAHQFGCQAQIKRYNGSVLIRGARMPAHAFKHQITIFGIRRRRPGKNMVFPEILLQENHRTRPAGFHE